MHLATAFLSFFVFFTAVLGFASGDVVTDSGALTSLDVFWVESTNNWAGVYGQVSGVRAVGSQNPIFEWDSSEVNHIYFSEEAINFTSNWKPGNKSLLLNEYSFLGNKSDGVNTFNSSINIDTVYQENTIENVPAAMTSNSSGQPYWGTGYLHDGSNGFFAGEVDEGEAFDGQQANYQVLLPENGTDQSATSFQIWIELSEG
ncbi:MAG: hypothetical protein ACI9LV_000391 [Candidatus Nanohaloarchaea archaeon]|jgi:hypothetical protein